MSFSATNILLISRKGSLDSDYLDMQPNAKLPEDAFVFTPPPEAKFIDPADPRFLREVPAGEAAPDLELALIDGKTVTLHEIIKDKVGLVSFWATWCVPCIEEMPALARLHEEFAERGVVIIGVSRDSSMGVVKAFLSSRPMPYTMAHDGGDMGGERYHFTSIPHTVLVDRQGKVVKTWQGWSGPDEEAEIRDAILKLVAGQ